MHIDPCQPTEANIAALASVVQEVSGCMANVCAEDLQHEVLQHVHQENG